MASTLGYRPGESTPVTADAAVTAFQAVVWASDGHVTNPGANNNDQAFAGFIHEDDIGASADGELLERGEAIALAAGSISVGDLLQIADADGQLETASTTGADIIMVVARAKTAASNAGDQLRVEIMPGGPVNQYNA